jgi:protein-arginine deiminase
MRPHPNLLAALTLVACNGGKNDTGEGSGLSIEFHNSRVSSFSPESGAFPGLVGVPNLDDDDENGTMDWEDEATFDEEDDRTSLVLHTAGLQVRLELNGEIDQVRIWRNGDHVMGAGLADAPMTLSGSEEDVALEVEFADYLSQARLDVSTEDGESFSLRLTAAPLVLYHHLDPATEVWMMEYPSSQTGAQNNDAMADTYRSVLGDAYTKIRGAKYNWDPWVQDEFEWAVLDAPENRMGVVIDSIRNGQGSPGSGLDNVPEDMMEGPGVIVEEWGEGRASSLDYFGNLEVSPPVTVDGVHYPFGRVYTGGKGAEKPKPQLEEFLESQGIQDPFMVDSTWLCVGHVDEFSTFIPDPDAPKGFRLLMTDTREAWELLEAMPASTSLPMYAQGGQLGYGIQTVGQLLADRSLRNLNDEIQELYLDTQLAKFKAELDLDDADILTIPGLFEEPGMCGPYAAALIPGMANLVVAKNQQDQTTLFIPDPFIRSDSNNQGSDPFIQALEDRLPASMELHFVDDWAVYHMGLGEVHCGSNVNRTPSDSWWESGVHLLEDRL